MGVLRRVRVKVAYSGVRHESLVYGGGAANELEEALADPVHFPAFVVIHGTARIWSSQDAFRAVHPYHVNLEWFTRGRLLHISANVKLCESPWQSQMIASTPFIRSRSPVR